MAFNLSLGLALGGSTGSTGGAPAFSGIRYVENLSARVVVLEASADVANDYSATFTLTGADVAAHNGSYTVTAGQVRGDDPVPLRGVHVTGSAGDTLTADPGVWSDQTDLTFSYQWQADGVDISGATAVTYDSSLSPGTDVRPRITASDGTNATSINGPATTIPNVATIEAAQIGAFAGDPDRQSGNAAPWEISPFDLSGEVAGTLAFYFVGNNALASDLERDGVSVPLEASVAGNQGARMAIFAEALAGPGSAAAEIVLADGSVFNRLGLIVARGGLDLANAVIQTAPMDGSGTASFTVSADADLVLGFAIGNGGALISSSYGWTGISEEAVNDFGGQEFGWASGTNIASGTTVTATTGARSAFAIVELIGA